MENSINNSTEKKIKKTTFLWIIALTVFLAVSMNNDLRASYFFWYGSIAFVVIAFLFEFGGKIPLVKSSFLIWFAIFLIFSALSILWCLSTSVVVTLLKTLIVFFVVLALIQFALVLGFDINTLIKCYLIAIIITAIYLILVVDFSSLGEVELGSKLLDGWNANGIGFMTASGALFSVYLFGREKNKIIKILIAISIVFLSILTIYTGSRTAFIVLFASFILYYWVKHPEHLVMNMVITLFVVALLIFLIMNVEAFYNTVGQRFEGFFAFFGDGEGLDSSARLRKTYIENGKKWFWESPLLGYGLNNYKVLNKTATGKYVYAHNTFIELAVNLGVVGLAIYYFAYGYLLINLLKLIKKNEINVLLLVALVASLVNHYGSVCYYSFYQCFLLLLCFFVVDKEKKEKNKRLL